MYLGKQIAFCAPTKSLSVFLLKEACAWTTKNIRSCKLSTKEMNALAISLSVLIIIKNNQWLWYVMIVIKMTTGWGIHRWYLPTLAPRSSRLCAILYFPQTLFPGTTYPVMSRKVSRIGRTVPNSVWFPSARCLIRARCDTSPNLSELPTSTQWVGKPPLQVDPASPRSWTSVRKSCNAAASPGFHGGFLDVFGPGFWHQSWLKIHLNHLGFSVEKIAV